MNNAGKLSDLIYEWKDRWKEIAVKTDISQRDFCYEKMIKEHGTESREKQFAYGFEYFLKEKSISVQDNDMLAGFAFRYTYNVTYPTNMDKNFDPTKKGYFQMDLDREVEDIVSVFGEEVDKEKLIIFKEGVQSWLYKHWHCGHFIAGYDSLLKYGFGEIYYQECLALETEEDLVKRDNLQAFQIVTKAAISYIYRYARMAKYKEEQAVDKDIKNRMKKIRESCERIAEGKPQTFFDAIQLLWFGHELLLCESYPSAVSIGRFDQYLYPFYKKDIQEGKITETEVRDLIAAFWLKCSTNIKAFQNLTLGGSDRNGNNCANELTVYCLEITRRLKLDQPSVSFLWTPEISQNIWNEILELIKTGMGFPAIFNDECCKNACRRNGIKEDDVHRYAIVGCVELGIPGKEYTLTEICRINLPEVLRLMLHHGKDPENGMSFPLKRKLELDRIGSFDEFYNWYLTELENVICFAIECVQRVDAMYGEKYLLPFLSTLVQSCVKNRKDVVSGGADYNAASVNVCGIATIADSLIAIKKLVFEEKQLTLSKLVRILERDFCGYNTIRILCEKKYPKFGNDVEVVDRIAVDIVEYFTKTVENFRTPRGGKYRVGLYTVEDHSYMGMRTGATPDGRKSGQAFSNSMSSVQGKDTNGPTALLNTVNKFDFVKAGNGTVLDLKFTPLFLQKEHHCEALKALIDTYFSRGGMEIQISVVSKEMLIDAQKHPEEYENLIVRVSGFSAYFTTLQKATQDEIISRTEVSGC